MENAVKLVFESPINNQMIYELQPNLEIIESSVIQGFRIPIKALFDDQENINTLKDLLA
jgi:hypothetical protein